MKKVLSIMLIILVVFSSMPMTVFGAGNQDNSNDEFTYALSEDNAIITGYNGSDLFVDIPSEIDGHSVTEISSTTFKNDNSIVGIEIPNGVTTIGQGAFKNCLKAQYISLPATLKNIDTNTLTSNDDCVYIVERNSDAEKFVTENDMNYKKRFASDKVSESGQDDNISYRYNNLTSSLYVYGEGEIKNYNSDNQPWKNYKSTAKSIDLFDGITSIGNYAFYNFTSVTPEVTIPSSVEKIGNSAFDCCTSLKKITIPDNVKIIGNRAFGSCTSVTEIELGTGLIQLGTDYRDYNNPFYYMTGVKKITFNSEKVPTTPCADTFEYMNNLETVYVPAKSYSQYVERFSSYINNAKFVLLNDDTDFIIEDGVLKLYQGNDANIVIPSDVTEIGPSAFRNNASIKTVEFSSNVEKISNNAFMGCTSLKSVALNNKLTTISYSSFNSCSALKEITIPDSVETIGDYAFYKCTSLSNELVIPSSVKTIGDYAFAEDNKITSVTIKGNEEGTTIGNYSFQNATGIKTLDLGNVTSIGTNAFNNCASLSGKLTIPDSVKTLNSYAFSSCKNINEIEFSKNLEVIGYESFANCTSLKKITIPDNIKTIENCAFENCSAVTEIELGKGLTQLGTSNGYYYNPFYNMTSVKKITFNTEKVPTTPCADTFEYMNNLETVYVPVDGYSDYVTRFSPYINNARIVMISDSDFVIKDGVLLQYSGTDTDVVIPDDVTVQVLTQAREHIIKRTFEALKGVKNAIVHVYNSTSVAQRQQVFRKSKEEIKQIAIDGAKLLKDLTEQAGANYRFEYSPESFTGTEPEFALEVCNAVLDVWQPTSDRNAIINLPATVQMSMPHVYASQIAYISQNLKYRENVVLSLHPHNDRGTGVADSEMGLLAGADRIEGTLFGNGERTGNADIITIAMNMFALGVDPKLDFSNMPEIIEMYERVTRMHVYERQPYAGKLVFAAFSGSHQDAIAKGMKWREENDEPHWTVPYLLIDPQDVGRQYDADVIRINSQSGKGGVAYVMEQKYGLNMPKKMREDFGYCVKGVSDHKHKELMPEEIYQIFQDNYVNVEEPYK